jgi:predicted esterase
MLFRALFLGFLLSFAAADASLAQRNDLAQRLAKLEDSWARRESAEARRRALPRVEKAVGEFFSFRLARAGQSLDEARMLLDGVKIDPARAWAASRKLKIESRVLDPQMDESLIVEMTSLYPAGLEPEDLSLGITCRRCDSDAPIAARKTSVSKTKEGNFRFELLFAKETSADVELTLTLSRGKMELDRFVHRIAVIPELDARLETLRAETTESENGAALDWRQLTRREGAKRLRRLRQGKTPENEPRALAELEHLESLASHPKGASLGPGDYHLALPRDRGRDQLRIAIPEKAGAAPPLLLLAHGAGGSENMFFDAYGRGRYVSEGLARGAIVVAPRSPLIGALDLDGFLERLAQIQPFDRRRVFLVGHSMGAGRLLGAALRTDAPVAALAAIAGGRPSPKPETLAGIPLFLGTASRDFGRAGVESLGKQMLAVEGARVELKVLEDCEHLLVVQDLSAEVFRFLEGQGLPKPRARR